MKPSAFDGKRILHVDGAGVAHSGVIVGQSDDDSQVYIQADRSTPTNALWDFSVSPDILPVLIENGKANP